MCYQFAFGETTIKHPQKAKECYEILADQKYIPAMYSLARILLDEAVTTTSSSAAGYQTAHHTHVDKEKMSQVTALLFPCAEAGFSPAQHILSNCYAHGYGVPKDDREALKLIRLAVAPGHAFANRNLGLYYQYGRAGVKMNISEAVKCFKAAKAQGEDVSEDLKETTCCDDVPSDRCTIM